jgi:hypothetical protein
MMRARMSGGVETETGAMMRTTRNDSPKAR